MTFSFCVLLLNLNFHHLKGANDHKTGKSNVLVNTPHALWACWPFPFSASVVNLFNFAMQTIYNITYLYIETLYAYTLDIPTLNIKYKIFIQRNKHGVQKLYTQKYKLWKLCIQKYSFFLKKKRLGHKALVQPLKFGRKSPSASREKKKEKLAQFEKN